MSKTHSVSTQKYQTSYTSLPTTPRARRSSVSNAQSEQLAGLSRTSPTKGSRIPKPMSAGAPSPSKLPRLQQTPRQHRHSVSLSVGSQTEKTPSPRKSCGAIMLSATASPCRPFPSSITASKAPLNNTMDTPRARQSVLPKPRVFVKSDPRTVLKHLAAILGPPESAELQELLPLDVLLALHEREVMEGAARLQRARSIEKHADTGAGSNSNFQISRGSTSLSVFGFPLRQTSLYASTKAILGGYEHELPILVFTCVEELYRTGLSTILDSEPDIHPSSTASPESIHPDLHPRVPFLVDVFNSPSHKFGFHTSLASERPSDIYALLATFLSQLPEPVLAPTEIIQGLKDALWVWCVKPKPSSSSGLMPLTHTSVSATNDSSHSIPSPSSNTRDSETRFRIAQLLLRLLPSPNLSLFIYMMAFACQVHQGHIRSWREKCEQSRDSKLNLNMDDCPPKFVQEMSSIEAQLLALEQELEDERVKERAAWKLGRKFGRWLFGPEKEAEREDGFVYVVEDADEVGDRETGEEGRSTQMMVWFLNHWGKIIRGFFEDLAPPADTTSRLLAPIAEDNSFQASQFQGSGTHRQTGASDEGMLSLTEPVMPENLLSSSPSFATMENGINESGIFETPQSVDAGRKDAQGDDSASKNIRMGMVRGKSYGEATPGPVPSNDECSASIHSGRDLAYGSESNRHAAQNMSSTTSFASALDERLLDAESDTDLSYLHLPAMPLPVSLPRVISCDFRPVQPTPNGISSPMKSRASSVYSEDIELLLDERYRQPLRVVNRTKADSPMDSPVDEMSGRLCGKCDTSCVAHAYVKELEARLKLVTRERDEALARAACRGPPPS